MKWVPFLSKVVYKRVRGWISGRSLLVNNYVEYPPSGKHFRVNSCINFLIVPDGSNTEVDQGLKDKVIQQIHQACRDVGFFYLTGHGVEQSTMDKIFTVMKSFFALPLATKNTINIHNSEFYRGYFETSKFHYMH